MTAFPGRAPGPDAAKMNETTLTPHALLQLAEAQRSRFYLSFAGKGHDVQELDCALSRYDGRIIELDTTSVQAPGHDWRDRPVTVYFRVARKTPRVEDVFYTFSTTLVDTATPRRGQVRLTLRVPARVDVGQRRKSIRVEPNLENITGLHLWTYDARGGFRLDNPVLTRQDFDAREAALLNLSAGGMRVLFRRELLKKRGVVLEKGGRLIAHLSMRDAKSPVPEALWIIAKIIHVFEDRVTKDRTAGLEFVAHGRVDPETRKVAWSRVDDNVIAELANLTYLWHLEKYREKL